MSRSSVCLGWCFALSAGAAAWAGEGDRDWPRVDLLSQGAGATWPLDSVRPMDTGNPFATLDAGRAMNYSTPNLRMPEPLGLHGWSVSVLPGRMFVTSGGARPIREYWCSVNPINQGEKAHLWNEASTLAETVSIAHPGRTTIVSDDRQLAIAMARQLPCTQTMILNNREWLASGPEKAQVWKADVVLGVRNPQPPLSLPIRIDEVHGSHEYHHENHSHFDDHGPPPPMLLPVPAAAHLPRRTPSPSPIPVPALSPLPIPRWAETWNAGPANMRASWSPAAQPASRWSVRDEPISGNRMDPSLARANAVTKWGPVPTVSLGNPSLHVPAGAINLGHFGPAGNRFSLPRSSPIPVSVPQIRISTPQPMSVGGYRS